MKSYGVFFVLLDILPICYTESSACVTFESISTDTLNITSVGVFSGTHEKSRSNHDCSIKCIIKGSDCWAYHADPDGRCFLIFKNRLSWNESDNGHHIRVMARNSHPKCTPTKFPHHRGRSRYRLNENRMFYNESSKACQEIGGKLVQITTDLERLFVWNVIREAGHTTGLTFTGLRRDLTIADHASGFRWQPSGDLLTSTWIWREGDPNGHGGNQYFGLMVNRKGLLNDREDMAVISVCECLII